MYSIPVDDLKNIFERVKEFWPRGKSFLITGGTGFFGRWLVEAIAYVEQELKSGNRFVIVTRQERAVLLRKIEVLALPFFQIETLDLENIAGYEKPVDFIIHAASDVAKIKSQDASDFSSIVKATENVIRIKQSARLLYVSSGGVYKNGKYPNENEEVVSLKQKAGTYAEAKVASENAILSAENTCVARCFSFVGPFADSKMVSMDMLEQKIADKKIVVKSPEVIRSYMYPSDLVVALFKLLLLPAKYKIYNVGSSQPVKLMDLAAALSEIGEKSEVTQAQQEGHSLAGSIYYPDTARFDREFGNSVTVSLDVALQKTFNFLTQRKSA